jgi:hypothetical protein
MAAQSSLRTILEALPDDLAEFLSWTVPAITVPNVPTTVEGAIIANGTQSHNEALVLASLEGLPLIKLLLRLGQHSNINIVSALLSAWEETSGTVSTAFEDYESSFAMGDAEAPTTLFLSMAFKAYEQIRKISTTADNTAEACGINYHLPEGTLDGINSWCTDLEEWWAEVEDIIISLQDAEAAGEEMPEYTLSPIPLPPPLPVPPDPTLPAPLYWFMWVVYWVNRLGLAPVVRRVVREIIRKIATGGNFDPWILLFKHFGFLWPGKETRTPPPAAPADLTSIHLLLADKPIEIIDSLGNIDVFLDTDTRIEEE